MAPLVFGPSIIKLLYLAVALRGKRGMTINDRRPALVRPVRQDSDPYFVRGNSGDNHHIIDPTLFFIITGDDPDPIPAV